MQDPMLVYLAERDARFRAAYRLARRTTPNWVEALGRMDQAERVLRRASAPPQVLAPRPQRRRGAGRPRAQARRSCARSGDSGDSGDGPGEPEPAGIIGGRP